MFPCFKVIKIGSGVDTMCLLSFPKNLSVLWSWDFSRPPSWTEDFFFLGLLWEIFPQDPKGHILRPKLLLFLLLCVCLSFSLLYFLSPPFFFPAVLRVGASRPPEINTEDAQYVSCPEMLERLQLVSDCLILSPPPLCSDV